MLELVLGRVVISGMMYGYGLVNDAGRELLSFLLSHEVAVCNARRTFISRCGSTPSQRSGVA